MGILVEFSYKAKSHPGGIALRRRGTMSLLRSVEGGESSIAGFFQVQKKERSRDREKLSMNADYYRKSADYVEVMEKEMECGMIFFIRRAKMCMK